MAPIIANDSPERALNRFELVLLAGERSRPLGRGEPQTVEASGDPRTLVSQRRLPPESYSHGLREQLVLRPRRQSFEELKLDTRHEEANLGPRAEGGNGEVILPRTDQVNEKQWGHAA
ncbi:hypothetical protein ABIE65_005235 [Constrictibacter sp. MBR-5]|jgi:hypothetical protein